MKTEATCVLCKQAVNFSAFYVLSKRRSMTISLMVIIIEYLTDATIYKLQLLMFLMHTYFKSFFIFYLKKEGLT